MNQIEIFGQDTDTDTRTTELSGRPLIYVTNWSSTKLHGPGMTWTIMAKPRHWERGDGVVWELVPSTEDLELVRIGALHENQYWWRYMANISKEDIVPSKLQASAYAKIPYPVAVAGGDTLCCSCSREQAARRKCHRVWAAELLIEAGWAVVLDGEFREAL